MPFGQHNVPETGGYRNLLLVMFINFAKFVLSLIPSISLIKKPPLPNITLPKLDRLDLDSNIFSPILQTDFLNIKVYRDLQGWRKLSLRYLPESAMELARTQAGNNNTVEVLKAKENANITCIFPNLPSPEVIPKLPDEKESKELVNKAMRALKNFSPSSKGCIQYTDGWWTYEMCHLKRVRQFHKVTEKERDEMIRKGHKKVPAVGSKSSEFLLGRFLPNSLNATVIRFGNVFSVKFRDGDNCKTVDRGVVQRSAEVRFECSLSQLTPHFLDVVEDSICHYILIIGTRALCDIPSFRSRIPDKKTIWCIDKNENMKAKLNKQKILLEGHPKSKLERLLELAKTDDAMSLLKQVLLELLSGKFDTIVAEPSTFHARRKSLMKAFGEHRAQSLPQSMVGEGEENSTKRNAKEDSMVKLEVEEDRQNVQQIRIEL